MQPIGKLKTRVSGRVTDVGWKPNTTNTVKVYATIEVKLSSTRRQDIAEEQIKTLSQNILGKKVVIFLEE